MTQWKDPLLPPSRINRTPPHTSTTGTRRQTRTSQTDTQKEVIAPPRRSQFTLPQWTSQHDLAIGRDDLRAASRHLRCSGFHRWVGPVACAGITGLALLGGEGVVVVAAVCWAAVAFQRRGLGVRVGFDVQAGRERGCGRRAEAFGGEGRAGEGVLVLVFVGGCFWIGRGLRRGVQFVA